MKATKLRIKADTISEGDKCVFLAYVGDRFYIGHSSSLEFVANELKKQWSRYHRQGVYTKHLFFPIIKHAAKLERPSIEIRAEFVSQSGYEVLKHELEMLELNFGTKKCLNENNTPYIPKTTHAKAGSNWLTQNEMLNFRKLLKKYVF